MCVCVCASEGTLTHDSDPNKDGEWQDSDLQSTKSDCCTAAKQYEQSTVWVGANKYDMCEL